MRRRQGMWGTGFPAEFSNRQRNFVEQAGFIDQAGQRASGQGIGSRLIRRDHRRTFRQKGAARPGNRAIATRASAGRVEVEVA